jgi:hypothetical protein
MREQMLRNIGAPAATPTHEVDVDLVDASGRKLGQAQLQAVDTRGTGKNAGMEMHARFGVWQGHALQIVAIGPQLEAEQTEQFLNSLRLVKR